MIVGGELGRLRVRLGAIEDIRDGFALVRSQGGYVDGSFTFSSRVAAMTAPA